MSGKKLLIVSDLHGSRMAYGKLSNAPRIYDCEAVIFAGDLTGKAVVPIVNVNDDLYEAVIFGDHKTFPEKELENTIKTIEMSGYYTAVLSKSEYEELANDEKKIRDLFLRVEREKLEAAFQNIENKFSQKKTKIYILPGNDDSESISEFAREYSSNSDIFVDIDERIAEVGDLQLLGFGFSNKTPWNSPRELTEEQIEARLSDMFDKIDQSRLSKTVAVIHVPPHGTMIDQAPALTPDLRPVIKGGDAVMTSVGSTAVRKVIEKYSPMMGIHGHIHESPGVDYIRSNTRRKVPVLNAGSEYQAGVLRGALVAVEDGNVDNVMLTRG